jgi:hypothetical protein
MERRDKMKDTPETKIFKTRIRGIDGDKHWVPAGFAEILERERDEAKRLLDKKSKYLAQAITQRDHAETELRKLIDFSKSVLVERNKWRKCAEKLAEIIGAPDEMESRLWKTDDEINEAWSVFEKLKEDAK